MCFGETCCVRTNQKTSNLIDASTLQNFLILPILGIKQEEFDPLPTHELSSVFHPISIGKGDVNPKKWHCCNQKHFVSFRCLRCFRMSEDTAGTNNANANNGGDEEEVQAVEAVTRGPNFTPQEDLELVKAWVCTSEDPIVGAGQKATEFKEKFVENCHD